MLDPQVMMNLFPQACIGVGLVNHGDRSVYLAADIALANKMMGQMAMNTMSPNAISSHK